MRDQNWVELDNLGPLSVNHFGEKFFFNLQRNIFDKISAYALFDARFADRLFKENTLTIVVGTDSGLLPQYINSRSPVSGSRYIFIEPDRVLHALHANGLLAGLNERIVCVGINDWVKASHNFKITDYFYINSVQSLNALCAQDDYIDEYAELSWHVTEVLDQLHWVNTTRLGEEAFIARQFDNVADNLLPAKLLEGGFRDGMAVVLAGGPSLDGALAWVKRNRDRLVIFSVARVSKRLLEVGVEPDFVVSVDPQDMSFDNSKEMLEFSRRVVFIYSYHVVPTLLSQWHGLAFFLGDRLPWQSPLNVPNFKGVGPTVTNTALSVADSLGFKQVILAGVDLCFTRDGFTHAKGSNEALAGPRFNLTSLQVETNGGYQAPTSCDFLQAIQALAIQAHLLAENDCRIITVSEGGAKIQGIDYVPVTEIKLNAENVDVRSVVVARLTGAYDASLYLGQVLDELKRARFQVNAIADLAKQARRINDEMYDARGIIVDYKDKRQLDKIEQKLKRKHRHYSKLVKRIGIRSLIQLAKPFSDEEWTSDQAKELGNAYYDAYFDGATRLLVMLDNALERTQVRQEELSEVPDVKTLIAQCQKDHSYGRVRLWRERLPSMLITDEINKEFDELENLYVSILNNENTQHLARAKSYGDLSLVKHRAALLFKHKKITELQDLLTALDKHPQQDLAGPYQCLVNAYLAELQNQLQVALDYYQKIIERGEVLIEQALSRIAGIGIETEDVSTADLALQCLSQINPVYLPLYAEMLRLNGNMVESIDAYNSYISQFPLDTVVQMKLVRLFMECKVYDGAEMMLDYILQQKPDFQAAISMKAQIDVNRQM